MENVKLLTKTLITDLTEQITANPRKRINHNFHQLSDYVQRFLNIVDQSSYIQPHKHQNPDKTETFIILKGKIKFFIFDDQGSAKDFFILSPEEDNLGIDILPGIWHSFVTLSTTAAVFEIKEGPYFQQTDKIFAPFAPKENEPESADYLRYLREYS
ncbi:MAG: hypothetical protein A2X42_05975 [Candidatus Margulisbacteria bacterium GWF2_38_17]|nr:MAG: hypothetical protein A2X42_05975 [Candidatus Margulisbacteria bacterium GWF2_38_17]